MIERYSIEVNDCLVEIRGTLTIEEAFDFLNFFDKKGYTNVVEGDQNSTIRMLKMNKEENTEKEKV